MKCPNCNTDMMARFAITKTNHRCFTCGYAVTIEKDLPGQMLFWEVSSLLLEPDSTKDSEDGNSNAVDNLKGTPECVSG